VEIWKLLNCLSLYYRDERQCPLLMIDAQIPKLDVAGSSPISLLHRETASRDYASGRLPATFPATASVRFLPIWLTRRHIRPSRDSGNFHLGCRELDEKQHDEPLQSATGPHRYCEEVGGHDQLPVPVQKFLFQVVFRLDSGAGSIPCRRRMSAIVL
jgi:hypothetical protein